MISFWDSHEMCFHRRWPRNSPGNSRRLLWQPCGFKNISWQSLQIRFLLANSFVRCRGPCSMMSRVPILRQTSTCSSPQPDHDPSVLAFRLLDPRYDRSTNNSARRVHSRLGSSRQIHKVDRVQTNHQDFGRQSSRLHQQYFD